jgi:hypothetical protein
MLSRVLLLRDANAQWPAIEAAFNPGGDSQVRQMLEQLRGPHLFTPHLALGVIEDGCRRAVTSFPGADARDALREAIRSTGHIVRD